jgi:glutamine cyclotransferase
MMPVQPEATPDWVLNGIAYDRDRDRVFVTGKNWPSIFEIKLKPRS